MRVLRKPLGREFFVGIGAIPIAAPFPDVAGQVVESVGAGSVLRDGGDPLETVFTRVTGLNREFPLVDVCLKFPTWLQLISPGEKASRKTAAGR